MSANPKKLKTVRQNVLLDKRIEYWLMIQPCPHLPKKEPEADQF